MPACTEHEGLRVDPPTIPIFGDESRPAQPLPEPLGVETLRFMAGARLALWRAVSSEARAGRRVAYDGFADDEAWVAMTSRWACRVYDCEDACVGMLTIRVPRCGTLRGHDPDDFTMDVEGCGPRRSHAFTISYDPLRLDPAPVRADPDRRADP
ncbi:MAG: hypothetical protein K0V04_00595 [Deltaproteobacteria bacterium]|nr:hypothetical protein [Deltaproteobacteria bacterium]